VESLFRGVIGAWLDDEIWIRNTNTPCHSDFFSFSLSYARFMLFNSLFISYCSSVFSFFKNLIATSIVGKFIQFIDFVISNTFLFWQSRSVKRHVREMLASSRERQTSVRYLFSVDYFCDQMLSTSVRNAKNKWETLLVKFKLIFRWGDRLTSTWKIPWTSRGLWRPYPKVDRFTKV